MENRQQQAAGKENRERRVPGGREVDEGTEKGKLLRPKGTHELVKRGKDQTIGLEKGGGWNLKGDKKNTIGP